MDHKELFEELIEKIELYHPSKDYSMVQDAYDLALDAHGTQLRKSGEAYIIHPLSVALILVDLELDLESITAGILHDVIEDTDYTYDDLAERFGTEVAEIVDGVTKFNRFQYQSKEEQKAETYRKMFLAMAKDIRVILIKIADRLHNMRTLQYMTEAKQKEIAQETLDIYAPIAGRLGISKIKDSLEDLSFKYLHPEDYHDLAQQIKRKQSERKEYVRSICKELENALLDHDLEGDVQGRPKHFFSIYKKMVSQSLSLDQIYDLFAFRIIVDDIETCYRVVGIVHEMYVPIPGRFKDYIAMKKENEYQSLHTTLMGPGGEPFEVQIRTWEMHKIAEYGIAAHWKYKEGADGKATSEDEEKKLAWLRQILEWQQEYSDDNKEYMQALKGDLDIFQDNVYCFTPDSEVISLKRGSTPLDFAYKIHSAVGNQAVGARVDGRIVPFDYVLENGNRVEILTSRNSPGPSLNWLNLVKTSQAKSKINQWFKKQNREEYINRGKDILDKEVKKHGIPLSKLLANGRRERILTRHSYADWDTVLASIGIGSLKEAQVVNRLVEEYKIHELKNSPEQIHKPGLSKDEIEDYKREKEYNEQREYVRKKDVSDIQIKGLGDFAELRLSKCCTPVPGDEIVGFITRGRGVSIHRTDCVNVINLSELERQRLIDTWWIIPEESSGKSSYRAELLITGNNRTDLFIDVCSLFNTEGIPIKSINARVDDNNKYIFDISIDIKSRKQLDDLSDKILDIKGIVEVDRART